jgi:penicillin amidase
MLVLLLAAASGGPVACQPASRLAEASASVPQGTYGRVELVRDTWGVAHVFAETDEGAMYGLGYACAEDRAFQMHYSLRIIQGRLAEVVGDRPSARRDESAVFSDRKMRTFGFYRAAKAAAEGLDADAKAMLMAYCDGVNDSIAAHRDTLHPLFDKLGLKPEPWTPADCIASFWHLGQFFATDGTRELIHYRNIVSGGAGRPAVGRDGRPMTPPTPGPAWMDDESAVVLRSDVSDDWLTRVDDFLRLKGLSPVSRPAGGPAGPKFSHAWAVGGKKTTTGSAVLVSDPQTPIRYPSIWQEFHVCGKTFNARGVGVPGSPGLLIGWNENVAWGVSALGADQADLFRLRTDADHPDQYFLDGKWRDMSVRRETVAVKDGRPTELVVRETVFGPVVTPFAFAAPGDPPVALKRVPVCSNDVGTFRAMLAMMRAKDADAFARAISTWQFPSIHLIFGDKRGDIGYWLLAAIPVRSGQDAQQGAAALDGTRSEMDWQGFVPHDLLPHVINPSRGWIASANHRAIGSFYPMPLGLSTGSAGHTVRSWRLYERLAARERFEPNDVLDIHLDTVSPARREIVHAGLHLRAVLKRELSADATSALQRLDGWYARGATSDLTQDGAELAGEINTFFRLMSTPLAGKYGGGESGLSRFLRDLQSRIARDAKADLSREEQQFIDQALAGAWQSALNRYGDDPARWNAQARSAVTTRRIGLFDSLDGFGSLEAQADLAVPALTCVDGGTIKSQAAQSYTQYVPLHDVDSARSLLPPGHSELADSPLKTSTVELWQKGELHPAPLSRQAVEKIASSHRTLGPGQAMTTTTARTPESGDAAVVSAKDNEKPGAP